MRKRFGWARRLQVPSISEGVVPLISLPKSSSGVVHFIYGGRGIINKLLGMGIRPGVKIHVIENSIYGIVISVNGTKIGLCPRLASMIYVKQAG